MKTLLFIASAVAIGFGIWTLTIPGHGVFNSFMNITSYGVIGVGVFGIFYGIFKA